MIIDIIFVIMALMFYRFCLRKKDYTNPLMFIFLGFYVALLFYNFGWSSLYIAEDCLEFNYVIIIYTIITIVFSFLSYKYEPNKISQYDKIKLTTFGNRLSIALPLLWILLFLLENYLGSGFFFPALSHVDAHKVSLPIISYFTYCIFLPVSFSYFVYKSTKSRLHILFVIICIALPVVSRSARMQSLIAILQVLTLVRIFSPEFSSITKQFKYKKYIILLLTICSIVYMVHLTTYRMNHYGTYDLIYGEEIGYTGPALFGILSIYYGYFPLSFNNLKLNILYNNMIEHNYIGLYSFTCFWFGLLQIDNILDIPTNGHNAARIVTSYSATVTTGLWEFWYDFGYLCFIPILVAYFITFFIMNKAHYETKYLTYRTIFAWYIPFWFFLSFQNVLFQSINIVASIILYYIIKKSFIMKQQGVNKNGK